MNKKYLSGFNSLTELVEARLELAQSMRDRAALDQDEAARALREAASQLRAIGSPPALDTAETMELAATMQKSK